MAPEHMQKSDLTLVSGSDEYYVHQSVVCSQSRVIEEKCAAIKKRPVQQASSVTKMLSSVGLAKPKSIKIDISGDDDVVLEAMVHFFYHGNYYPDSYITDKARFDADSGFHAAVLRVAIAYGVNDLQILARELKEKALGAGGPRRSDGIRVVKALE